MNALIVIPARLESSRLPRKPLLPIQGKPLIQHVYERALQARRADGVIVATDSREIFDVVQGFGGTARMTSSACRSGSDRLVEVAATEKADIYVNLQGDEPLVVPSDIDRLIEVLQKENTAQIATLYHPVNALEAKNPNNVKVVFTHQGNALYFSRSLIPFVRQHKFTPQYYKHIGLYAYRNSVLCDFSRLLLSPLEESEQLEQLRLLQAGYTIRVLRTENNAPGVDTWEDMKEVERIFAGGLPTTSASALEKIKLCICDVDGVLTDGTLFYSERGESLKAFHARDGLAINILQAAGIEVAVLSGRDSPALRRRIRDLGIRRSMLGKVAKRQACRELMRDAGVTVEETACIGDDLVDLPLFEECAISFAVADAVAVLKERASYLLQHNGGRGAVREMAEMLLEARGKGAVFTSAEAFENLLAVRKVYDTIQ